MLVNWLGVRKSIWRLTLIRKRGSLYLYNTILVCRAHKVLRHGSHSFTCKLHHDCLAFISVNQMAPPLTEVADIGLQLTTHLIYQPGRDERLSGPGWLTYSGRFTHVSGCPSATGRAQDREVRRPKTDTLRNESNAKSGVLERFRDES